MDSFFSIFSYGFMVRAFLAGVSVGVIAPLIGIFLVTKRYSLMADSLAHVSLAGVALGLMIGISPLVTSVIVAVATALLIEKLRTTQNIAGETVLAMFLSGGLALAIVMIGLGQGLNVDLFSYLFGSITTVTPADLWVIGGLSLVILATIAAYYQKLVYLSFDEEAAAVSGVPTQRLNITLMVLTALTVSLGMRIVGGLLIGALMVIPVVTAMQLRQSFFRTMLLSVGFSCASVVSGLLASYYLNLASGGTIVVITLIIFFLTTLTRRQMR